MRILYQWCAGANCCALTALLWFGATFCRILAWVHELGPMGANSAELPPWAFATRVLSWVHELGAMGLYSELYEGLH